MPKKEPTRYAVHSTNTGAVVCGPYDKKHEADRECRRLNKEAATGVQAATGEPINYLDVFHCAACQSKIEPEAEFGYLHCPQCRTADPDGWVSVRQIPQRVTHEGVAQGYEIRSRSADGVEVVIG